MGKVVDKANIAEAISNAPKAAADALLAVQTGQSAPLSFDALKAVASLLNQPVAEVAADEIERRGLIDTFARALQARGVAFDADDAGLQDTNFDPVRLKEFIWRAKAFRCRVRVNNNFAGSGCLISPSLVLTAWHVIAAAEPGEPNPAGQAIEVLLSDGVKRRAANKPSYASACTEAELQGQLPHQDATFNGFNDIALIKLERPDGSRLGFARLPEECQPMRSRSSIMLLHFPQGEDTGFGFGKIAKCRGISARLRHDVTAGPGSSGGPCFNSRFALVGLHQGKWPPDRRLVPVERFIADIRPLIARDVAPPVFWSLDGTIHGPLVIGRDLFFEAVAAATRPGSRVRGVRVKRRDLGQGTAGLSFSLEMLALILARNPGAHRAIRVNFEPPYVNLIDEVQRRARLAGLEIPPAAAGADARAGGTTLEAAVKDQARKLVESLNVAAKRAGQLLWFLFDNPPVGLIDTERFAFEAFSDAALKQPDLRLVLAGYETISTPGEEFANAGVADADGAPGLVVEYFGLFNRGDVEQLLRRACQDFGAKVDAAVIADRANQILLGLNTVNGQYSTADLKTVSERAVPHLDYLRSLAEAAP